MDNSKSAATESQSTTTMIEQLGVVFAEIETHGETSSACMVPWKEIEGHFLDLENSFKKKLSELVEKEKALEEKETKTSELLVQREAEVAAKEQALLDRLQVLKDSAVSAIVEVRSKYNVSSLESTNIEENTEKKVSSSSNGENPLSAPEEKSLDKSDPHPEAVAVEVKPCPELIQLCEQMDVQGLLKYISENRNILSAIREEMPLALKSAPEPAQLVLDSLEGCYPPDSTTSHEGNSQDMALKGLRKSCILLMESVAPVLMGTETEHTVSAEMKQQVKAIADEWKPKLAGEVELDAADGSALEAQAFLQLLATFGIASEFDEDELCKLVLAVSHRRQTSELCRSLGLTHKVPGIVDTLVGNGRQIDAVHFIQAFQLVEMFPPVPLLKTYLKDLRRNSQGKGGAVGAAGVQNDANAQELAALKAVIRCIEEYKLEGEYELSPLQKRVVQLQKAKTDKKRIINTAKPSPKRPRASGRYGSSRQPPPMFVEVGGYHESLDRYPYMGPPSYEYPPPSQAMYGQQPSYQQPYFYQEEQAPVGMPGPPNYNRYPGDGFQGNAPQPYYYHGDQVSATPSGASSTYGRYTGSGLQPTH
ncbi:FRIGIDA-like protein 3 isoform X2 [Aristolochia californica]|uniref:FRIGIDA-like protein 3 isoform X2 n=1 Tax=Aristolochia californica TaxID=171875 RepID=UPI0035DB9D82